MLLKKIVEKKETENKCGRRFALQCNMTRFLLRDFFYINFNINIFGICNRKAFFFGCLFTFFYHGLILCGMLQTFIEIFFLLFSGCFDCFEINFSIFFCI